MLYFRYHPEDPFPPGLELVITELIMGDKPDHQAGGHTKGKPDHIDRSISFLAQDITPRDFQI
jgi:hypothetical protein